MTLVPLHVCCARLGIDPKTMRRWLALAHVEPVQNPLDARSRCVSLQQLTELAAVHDRLLLPEVSRCAPPPPDLPMASTGVPADRGEELDALHARVATLQEQVALLTAALLREQALHACPPPAVPACASHASSHCPLPTTGSIVPHPAPAVPLPSQPTPSSRPVLPRIELCDDGRVVVLCPQNGILALVPDSPEWFAWLSSVRSFRFQGPLGRFSAQLKTHRGKPTRQWHASTHAHNHKHDLYLGLTDHLTLARLHQMAATMTARIASR